MNFELKFLVFTLNLITWFEERIELLVAPFLELLNILVLEHKVGLKNFLFILLFYQTDSCSFLKFFLVFQLPSTIVISPSK